MRYACLAALALCAHSQLRANMVYNVTIGTASLAGSTGDLAFDFIDGGPPSNSVIISNFSSGGILGSPTPTGSVTGVLPGVVTLTDGSFFNEYLTGFKFGATIFFTMTQTGNAPAPGSSPDEFSFYLLDSTGANSLVTTSDPTGADALFGSGSDGSLKVFNSAQVTTTVTSSAPEPSSIWLLLGALAMLSRRRVIPALLAMTVIAALIGSSSVVYAQSLPPYNFTKIVDSVTSRPDGQGDFLPFANPKVAIDGNWAVFISFNPTQTALEIWSHNLSTQQFTKLVDFNTAVPGSPGGGHFVDFEACDAASGGYGLALHDGVVVFPGADSSATGCGGGIYSVPVAGGAISRVIDYTIALPGSGGNFKSAEGDYSLSISQGWVVFSAIASNGDIGVWAAQVNGNGLERIADENTVYQCPNGSCPYQYTHPFIQAGNVVFDGSGLFGTEGWQALFATTVGSPTLNPVLNSTQILPGDTGPNNPGKIADFLLPAIDGANIYFTCSRRELSVHRRRQFLGRL